VTLLQAGDLDGAGTVKAALDGTDLLGARGGNCRQRRDDDEERGKRREDAHRKILLRGGSIVLRPASE
jgi:hypothetical protein